MIYINITVSKLSGIVVMMSSILSEDMTVAKYSSITDNIFYKSNNSILPIYDKKTHL